MLVQLAAAGARATLDPEHGGRLASLQVDGMELLVTEGDSALDWGCYPMAPFAGRLRDGRFTFAGLEHRLPCNLPPHAIHGTVANQAWQVEHAEPTDAVLVTRLGPPWPFPGRVVHRIRIRDDRLSLRLEVWADDEPFPASCGWHPWWRRHLDRGKPVEIHLDAASMWERDTDGIPSGELVEPPPGPWDDCFTDLASPPVLHWQGALSLTVESTCMDVVVFDQLDGAVCIEPQTGPPDALRLAPIVVEPGLPLVAEATFAWRVAD
jgi:aldose 1-epimerase